MKRISAFLLALTLCLGLCVPAYAAVGSSAASTAKPETQSEESPLPNAAPLEEQNEAVFTDVKEKDWFYDAVEQVYRLGLMKGTGDQTFSPQLEATRAQLLTVLWRMAGKPKADKLLLDPQVSEQDYYAQAVSWAVENGIFSDPYGDGSIRPNEALSRQELAETLYGFAHFCGVYFQGENALAFMSEDPRSAWPLSYEDAEQISDRSYEAVCWCDLAGLLKGTGSRFEPAQTMTRAQMATVLLRLSKAAWTPDIAL